MHFVASRRITLIYEIYKMKVPFIRLLVHIKGLNLSFSRCHSAGPFERDGCKFKPVDRVWSSWYLAMVHCREWRCIRMTDYANP